jgi:DNA-binding NarL/FixJ family response regulator
MAATAEAAPPRVVVAEHSSPIRSGITGVLTDAGFDVAGACGDAPTLLALVESLHPHVAIVDLALPPTYTDEGLSAAEEIRTRWPGVGVLVLTPYAEVALAGRLLARGITAVGFLLQHRVADTEHFTAVVRRLVGGGWALDPLVAAQLLSRPDRQSQLQGLSSGERATLSAVVEGHGSVAPPAPLLVKLGLGPGGTSDDCARSVLGWLGVVSDGHTSGSSSPPSGDASRGRGRTPREGSS